MMYVTLNSLVTVCSRLHHRHCDQQAQGRGEQLRLWTDRPPTEATAYRQKKQEDKQRAPLLATWHERIAQAKLHADCNKSIVDLLENDEFGELDYFDYGELTMWVGVLLRMYLVPARSNMFNKVIWGTEKGENAEGCIHLREDETILIQLGRPSGGDTKNGKEVSIDTRDERFKNLEDLGMTNTKAGKQAIRIGHLIS